MRDLEKSMELLRSKKNACDKNLDALGGKSECNTECRVCKIKFGSILDWLQSDAE